MDLLNKYIDDSLKELNKKIKESSPKKVPKNKKEWDWSKYKFIASPNEELLNKTALKLVSVKKKYRTFDGALNVNKAYGPVDAMDMGSEVGSAGGSVVDAGGYGVGDYGVSPFGEALNRTSKNIKKAILNSSFDGETLKNVLDGYSKIFAHFHENSNLILHGMQPSFRDYIGFDMDSFIDGLNNYKGTIYSIVMSEAYDMESVELIAKWMVDIGVDKNVVSKIVFIEKDSKHEFDQSTSVIPYRKRKSKYINKISSLEDLKDFVNNLHNPILVGNVDIFMIGETSLASSIINKKYQIDTRYCYMI
jgi:hypothetical protein